MIIFPAVWLASATSTISSANERLDQVATWSMPEAMWCFCSVVSLILAVIEGAAGSDLSIGQYL